MLQFFHLSCFLSYWGQNSYGASHSDQGGWQKSLSAYCQDDTINVFPLAFLHVFFSTAGLPEINFANVGLYPESISSLVIDPSFQTCSSNTGVFSGTSLANCQFMASDIKACQARGKIITLSLGGATGAAGFTSDAQAQSFADTIWNLFLGGSSSTRPFGDAVLDGIDLDLEGGNGAYFPTFVNRIRSLSNGASKKYYVTAAPQCPYPDAYMGSILNAVGFDAVYVQCKQWNIRKVEILTRPFIQLTNFNNPNAWNFAQWDTWAKTVSPNRNVKIYIGAPSAPSAAGSGYVDASTLGNIAKQTKATYSSFGGVMLWDVSQAYGNNRFDVAIKNAITGGTTAPTTVPPSPTPTTPRPTSTQPPTTTQPPSNGSCAGVAGWVSNIAYQGGSQVVYKDSGHLWTASWWSQADVPGGAAGVWVDKGACSSFAAAKVNNSKAPSATHVIQASSLNNTDQAQAGKPRRSRVMRI
ncbi:hypothetical protein CVT24_011099 [Panaeolus cyanescens]|uniref:chitinase n=1 Tax=Panaeolus cyanescens TaxID=181874 RepID=A0A409YG13_9AGAR|nr:hypothetical protein CVT24_011099 [Panaeolus cyanescens]